MKHFIVTTILFVSLLFIPQLAEAHLGGGPPFLKINDKYAQTNIYNQGATTLTMPWDSPPETYLVDKTLAFEINVPELMKATTVPPEYAKDIKIRWSVATGDNFEVKDGKYQEGSAIKKIFNDPGSYLIIMEAKLPADSDYIFINTVQVDVLPSSAYKVPAASAYIGTQYDDPKKNVLLVSDSILDPSVKAKKYLWDFGDGLLTEGATINKRLEAVESVGVEPIFHRVVDEKGFISDVGFVAQKVDDKLRFTSFSTSGALPVAIGTYEEAASRSEKGSTKLSIPLFFALGTGAIIFIGYSWWLFLKKQK